MHVIYPFIVTVTCVSLSIFRSVHGLKCSMALIVTENKRFMNRYILIKITPYCTVVRYNDT